MMGCRKVNWQTSCEQVAYRLHAGSCCLTCHAPLPESGVNLDSQLNTQLDTQLDTKLDTNRDRRNGDPQWFFP